MFKYIKNDPEFKYRFICYSHINYIRQIILPSIEKNLNKEAVLIEFRLFPHIEFIIRNAIIKLGKSWSFTIVCGNYNHNLIKSYSIT